MSLTLCDEDGRAVDLFLNRNWSVRGNGGGEQQHGSSMTLNAAPQGIQKRVECVERLFEVLQCLPAADPPSNLVTRTLTRLDPAALAALNSPPQPPLGGSRPVM